MLREAVVQISSGLATKASDGSSGRVSPRLAEGKFDLRLQ